MSTVGLAWQILARVKRPWPEEIRDLNTCPRTGGEMVLYRSLGLTEARRKRGPFPRGLIHANRRPIHLSY